MQSKPLAWRARADLRRMFNDFLFAQTFPQDFDTPSMPRRWRQAQEVLGGMKLQLELRGSLGAAAMAETPK